MAEESLFGEFLPFGARSSVIRERVNAYTAPRDEESRNLDVFGVHEILKVLHYGVDAIFMETAVAAETEKIQLQALAFHHPLVGNVADPDFTEIGLSGDGTEGGEFGTVEPYPVIVVRVHVGEGLQHAGVVILTVLSLVSEGFEPFVLSSCGHGLFSCLFEPFGVLSDCELIDALLDVTVHEDGEVVHRPVDPVVGNP